MFNYFKAIWLDYFPPQDYLATYVTKYISDVVM